MTAAPVTRPALTRRELLLDVAFAVGLALFAVLLLSEHQVFVLRGAPIPMPRRGGIDFRRIGPSVLSYVLVWLSFLPLAVRRLYPAATLAVVAIAASLYQALPNPSSLVLIGVLVALYTAGTLMDRRKLMLFGGAATVLVLATSLPEFTSDLF
jgi:hypothetical protein